MNTIPTIQESVNNAEKALQNLDKIRKESIELVAIASSIYKELGSQQLNSVFEHNRQWELMSAHRSGRLEYLSKFGIGWCRTMSEDFVRENKDYQFRIIGEKL